MLADLPQVLVVQLPLKRGKQSREPAGRWEVTCARCPLVR